MRYSAIALAVTAALTTSTVFAASRDYISIVGSSTVYPFATAVAESFGKTTKFKTPKIESTGTGGGIKLFCAGVGVEHPDIANASRRMKKSEFESCAKNGVTEITEIKIGFDGIAIANSKVSVNFNMSLKDLYLALAKEVPNPDGSATLVANPYKTWKEVNAALPDTKIEVLGPPPTSGTRDAFVELAMEGGCDKIDLLKSWKKEADAAKKSGDEAKAKEIEGKHKKACQTVREDGAFIEAGENDNLIVQKLEANPKAIGIFGFSFLEQNQDKLQGSVIEGVTPKFETIADGSYPVSRSLFFYVKNAHVGNVPGIAEYLAEFTSNKAWGDEGYLSEKGLVPLPAEERAKYEKAAKERTNLSL